MGEENCLYAVVFSFVLFNILNKLVSVLFPPPEKLRDQVKKAWLWRNITISLLHSLTTAVLSSYSICTKPEMLEDMINAWTTVTYYDYIIALSTGYFFYDLMNLIIYDWERSACVVIHHIIVISAFLLSIISRRYIPFALVSLLMEINSIFLHSRRLMRMADINPLSLTYKVNGILLTITFVIFRLLVCGWMLNYLIMNRHVLPTLHFAVGFCGMCLLTPQNIFLIKQVWRSDSNINNNNTESQRGNESEKSLNATTNIYSKLKQFLRIIIVRGSE